MQGEAPVVSAGTALPGLTWKPYKTRNPVWEVQQGAASAVCPVCLLLKV
jgi:hypothetical protein